MHALIEAYPGPTGDRPFRRAWARLEGAVGPDAARGLLAGLERAFEPADPTVEAAGEPLEELLLLELAHRNPALGALRQLFVAPELTGGGAYAAAVAAIEHELGAGGGAAARQHGAGRPDGGRRAPRGEGRAPAPAKRSRRGGRGRPRARARRRRRRGRATARRRPPRRRPPRAAGRRPRPGGDELRPPAAPPGPAGARPRLAPRAAARGAEALAAVPRR